MRKMRKPLDGFWQAVLVALVVPPSLLAVWLWVAESAPPAVRMGAAATLFAGTILWVVRWVNRDAR